MNKAMGNANGTTSRGSTNDSYPSPGCPSTSHHRDRAIGQAGDGRYASSSIADDAGRVVAGWRAEAIGAGELRDRLEALDKDVQLGMEAAENYVAEAETDGQRAGAQSQLEALQAVRATLVREMERG